MKGPFFQWVPAPMATVLYSATASMEVFPLEADAMQALSLDPLPRNQSV